jgi:flagellar hook-associated protein 3 FlgL
MINLSTGAFYSRATRQIGSLRAQANDLQQQLGSGEKLSASSQDPVAAARLRSLSRNERLAAIDQTTSDRATHNLQLTDGALTSIADVIGRAKELATQAANATTNSTQRAAIGQEIAGLRENLLVIANSRTAAGSALFGGESAGAAYVANATGAITYAGTPETVPFDLGEGQRVTAGVTGPEVLSFNKDGVQTDLFATLGALSVALQDGSADPAAASRDALAGLDGALEKVTTAQTIVGARMGWVELMNERRETTGELMTEEREAIGGADLATTITRLQEVMTVLEASQASFVKLSGLSLFTMLR